MDSQDRKLQQRIARRKEKVKQLIKQQKARLAALDSATFLFAIRTTFRPRVQPGKSNIIWNRSYQPWKLAAFPG